MYKDPSNHLYLIFLKSILQNVNGTNILFQSTQEDVTKLHETLSSLVLSVPSRIFKPVFMDKAQKQFESIEEAMENALAQLPADQEYDTIASPPYVPPEPSCRQPLSRMVNEEAAKTLKAKHSESPKTGNSTSPRRGISMQPDFSSDDEEEKIDSSDYHDNQSFDLNQLVEQGSPRQRFLSTDVPDSPTSNADDTVQKHYDRGAGHHGTDNRKRAKMDSERNSPRTSGSEVPLGKYFCRLLFLITLIGIAFLINENWNPGNLPRTVDEPQSIQSDRVERIKMFKKNISDIRNIFPGQNRRTWGDIESGIIDVINQSQKLWITVLFSNETKELSCLAKMLGKASSRALHSEDSLELHPDDMGEDYGLAIRRLGPKITAKKAVIVHDLLNIDSRAIQAFHTICDRDNPLVEGTAFILTILTPGNVSGSEKPVKFIEDQLTNRFINKVPKEKLQPLITRLTDGPIISVKSEILLSACLEDSR